MVESPKATPLLQTARAAEHLVYITNALTTLREKGAPVIGALVATTGYLEPSDSITHQCNTIDAVIMSPWKSRLRKAATIGALLLSATDMEGNGYRLAKRIDPTITNPGGGERDHRADKRLFYNLMAGLCVRRYLQGNTKNASFMANVLAANVIRDRAMHRVRHKARGIDTRINTDAIHINKFKTALLLAGAITATTEWGEHGTGRAVAHGLLLGGTVTGAVGFWKFRGLMQQRMAAKMLDDHRAD